MGPNQGLEFPVRVDLEVMAIKGYFTFTTAPELEPHLQIKFSVTPKILSLFDL